MSTRVNQELLQAKCDHFVDVQLWPLKAQLQPEQWLSNFHEDELDHAIHLLNAFMYFSTALVDNMFVAAFQTLSRFFRGYNDVFLTSQAAWKDFLARVRFTYVTGEIPNPTDSGFAFARRARQLLGIEEVRIQDPESVLKYLFTDGPCPVVFVDDFVGSGSQFVTLWNRPIPAESGAPISFSQLSRIRGQTFYYCPLICCSKGVEAIQANAPTVKLNPCHILPKNYSAVAIDSVVWPATLLPTGAAFLRAASARAKIPDTDGLQVDDWQGFRKLGLTLAFAHSVPDATMPIFYWEKNGWKPLIRRT
jgi:hypothetical protein